MHYRKTHVRPALLAAAITIALPFSLHAQSALPSDQDPVDSSAESPSEKDKAGVVSLDAINVTARGRAEAQIDVPMSMRVFSGKAIVDAGVQGPRDIAALVPNLSLAESQSVGTSFMTIRGISQVRNGEPPMAVVVDGVLQSDAKQFTQELFDLQSIEVLRGPQGALYGRNASGGAILIHTKQPTNETSGYVQASAGTGGQVGVQGAVSGPIIADNLFYRVAGSYLDRDGYFDNRYLGRKADPYQDKTFRGLLKWYATDRLTLDLRINRIRDRAAGGQFQYQPTHLLADCSADPANAFDFSRLDPNVASRSFCANNLGENTRDLDEVTLKADYTFDWASLSIVASHGRTEEYLGVDQFPYTASRNLFGAYDGTQTQYVDVASDSLELRLISPSQQRLRWMVGAYGLKTDRFISTTVGSDLGLGIDRITHDPAFTSTTNPTLSWFADHNDNRAWAAFGNVDYDLTPKIEASLALRYDRDNREQLVDWRQTSGLPTGCNASSASQCTKRASYAAWQPRLSLRYKLSDTSLMYVTAGKGFRSGQFNQSGVAQAAATANPPVVGVSDQTKSEITRSLEAGYKAESADGRFAINTAVFRTDVTNTPYFVFIAPIGAQVLVGIDDVRLLGGEIEATARLTPGLTATAGLGVTRGEIRQYAVNPAVVGNRAPYVPDVTGNLGLQYRFGLLDGVDMLLRADGIWKGKQYWEPENSASRSRVLLLNLRAGVEGRDGRWSSALTIKNATNELYNAEWVSGGFAAPALPRTLLWDLRYNF